MPRVLVDHSVRSVMISIAVTDVLLLLLAFSVFKFNPISFIGFGTLLLLGSLAIYAGYQAIINPRYQLLVESETLRWVESKNRKTVEGKVRIGDIQKFVIGHWRGGEYSSTDIHLELADGTSVMIPRNVLPPPEDLFKALREINPDIARKEVVEYELGIRRPKS